MGNGKVPRAESPWADFLRLLHLFLPTDTLVHKGIRNVSRQLAVEVLHPAVPLPPRRPQPQVRADRRRHQRPAHNLVPEVPGPLAPNKVIRPVVGRTPAHCPRETTVNVSVHDELIESLGGYPPTMPITSKRAISHE